jgi:hypothetical protein
MHLHSGSGPGQTFGLVWPKMSAGNVAGFKLAQRCVRKQSQSCFCKQACAGLAIKITMQTKAAHQAQPQRKCHSRLQPSPGFALMQVLCWPSRKDQQSTVCKSSHTEAACLTKASSQNTNQGLLTNCSLLKSQCKHWLSQRLSRLLAKARSQGQ